MTSTSTQRTNRKAHTSLPLVAGSSLAGTAVEWYDFFLYGTAAALVFNKLFFPASDPLIGTMLAFATYAVGFIARPVGAAVLGHFGDRKGRRATLIASLMLMGGSTFLIGRLFQQDAGVPGFRLRRAGRAAVAVQVRGCAPTVDSSCKLSWLLLPGIAV